MPKQGGYFTYMAEKNNTMTKIEHTNSMHAFKTFKKQFDETFLTYIEEKQRGYKTFIEPKSNIEHTFNYLSKYAVWGKRIRPYLLDLTYRLCHGNDTNYHIIQKLWYILEMLQLFLLIHDDITDRGVIRHDIPAYHRHLAEIYNEERAGTSQAIILWDIIYTRVRQDLASLQLPYTLLEQFGGRVTHVAIGQMQDIDLSYQDIGATEQTIFTKDMLKTATYTCIMPMMLGAQLAGATTEQVDSIVGWAHDLWITFQMRDDLLDFGITHTNKTMFSDHAEGNQTYLLARLRDKATPAEKAYIEKTRKQTLSTQEQQKLYEIYQKYNIIGHAIEEVNSRLDISLQRCKEVFKDANPEIIEEVRYICAFLYLTQPDNNDNLPLKK